MDIYIAGTVNDSIVDGPGLRYTIFVQGCSHCCKGCQNPETWNPNGGTMMKTEDLMEQIKKNPLLSGITLSGGEPFEQPEPCLDLALFAHSIGLNVWCYTGYTYEELIKSKDRHRIELLNNVDVLVDGPYIQEQRSLDLLYRGSKNQRLIDISKTNDNVFHELVWWGEE